MNRPTILRLLNLDENSSIQILGLEVRLWGRGLIFLCKAEAQEFRLCFLDCSEARWRHYLHHEASTAAFVPTELLNFNLGRSHGRSPALILSEHFGLSLVYGEAWLEWDERRELLVTSNDSKRTQ
jgi:hypothetical protein